MPLSMRARARSNDFTLVLPGFPRPLIDGETDAPELQRLAAFAAGGLETTPHEPALEPWQVEVLMSLDVNRAASIASAALTWLGATSQLAQGWCAHVQPVVLSMSASGLSLQESDWIETQRVAVMENLRTHLAEQGLELRSAGRQLFLHGEVPLDVQTVAPRYAGGHSLREMLPSGRDAVFLRRLMTEVQMILHEKQPGVNFNSLWFWGAGSVRADKSQALRAVVTNEPFVRGVYLAMSAQEPAGELPDLPAVEPGSAAVVRAVDAALARRWLAAVLKALQSGGIERANVYLDGYAIRAKYSLWRRWFSAPRPVFALQSEQRPPHG